jgi:hypothetical protein
MAAEVGNGPTEAASAEAGRTTDRPGAIGA